MALDRHTISIRLAGGMQEHHDDFLVDSPQMEMVQNARLAKRGVFSKRHGFEQLGDTGLTVVNDGEPQFLHAIGENLYAVHDGGVLTYDGNAYTTKSSIPLFSAAEAASTSPKVGHEHSSFAYEASSGYVVAYDVITLGGQDRDVKRVCLEHYDNDGVLVFETSWLGNSPKITFAFGLATILYLDTDGGSDRVQRATYTPFTKMFTPTVGYVTPSAVNQRYLGFEPTAAHLRDPDGLGSVVHAGESRQDVGDFQVANEPAGDAVVAWTDPTTANLSLIRYTSHPWSVPTATVSVGSGITLTGAPATNPRYRCLALLATSVDHYALIAASNYDTTATVQATTIHLVRFDATNTQVWERRIFSHQPATSPSTEPYLDPCTGTLALDQTDDLFYAFEVMRSGPFLSPSYPDASGIRFGSVLRTDGTDADAQSTFFHHRISQNAVLFKNHIHLGIQQRFHYTPEILSDTDEDIPTTRARKPVTTAVCRVDHTAGRLIPIATVHAGRAMACDNSAGSTDSHVMEMFVDGDDLLVLDRELLSPPDIQGFVFSFPTGGGAGTGYGRRVKDLAPSEATSSITRLTQGAAGVSAGGFGDGILLGSALPLWFDGNRLVEATPLEAPEILGNTERVDGVDRKTVQLVLAYTDSKGNIHRSSPSRPVSLFAPDVVTGTSGDDVSVTLHYTMPISAYLDSNRIYTVEVYMARTAGADPTLVASALPDFDGVTDPDQLRITFFPYKNTSHPASSPALEGQLGGGSPRPIYTTGGVLGSDTWPSFRETVVSSNRLWALSAEDRGTVFYSKIFEEFVAPEFNGLLAISLGDERVLTGLGRLDDKIVVFESDQIHVIYGEGPDNLGRGDFAIHHVTGDVGALEGASIVETPRGLVFRSRRGFHLLTRDLRTEYIGGPIEDMAANIVVDDARTIPYAGEVRFAVRQDPAVTQEGEEGPEAATFIGDSLVRPPAPRMRNLLPVDTGREGVTLVWNYEQDAWSVFTNGSASASALYNGLYTRLLPDWRIWREDPDDWFDPGEHGEYEMLLRTPWIKTGNLQDFRRVRRISLLGRYMSAWNKAAVGKTVGPVIDSCDLDVTVGFDYEYPIEVETTERHINVTRVRFTANEDFQIETRNEPSGMSSVSHDARARRMQVAVRPHRQKTQAVQLTIRDRQTTADDEVHTDPEGGNPVPYGCGRGFEISGIDLEYAARPGSDRGTSDRRKR